MKAAVVRGGKLLERDQELAEAEQEDNDLEFERRKGDKVYYGQRVQLLHVASKRCLRTSSNKTSLLETRYV